MNKLGRTQIHVGCPVPFDCYDSQGHLLLKKGLIVDSQKQVDFLTERGLYSLESPSAATADRNAEKPPSPFQLLADYHNRLKQLFAVVYAEPQLERAPEDTGFPERLLNLARDLQELCWFDTDALLGAIHLDGSGRYSVAHPLYRAVICELLARRMGLKEEDRQRIMAAALTCDLSMLKLQDELIRQASPLQPGQQQTITAHPLETAKLLTLFGVTDAEWTTAVIQHHELLNGKGYPLGLSSQDVTSWARILKLADMYTAMVSAKAYRKAALSKTAMRDIFLKRGSEVDEDLAIFIVKELGVYPPGAFVKLQSGELAIVIHRGSNPQAPTVKVVVGPRGAPFDKPILRKTDIREYEILDVVERDRIVIVDLHKLWDYDA
jgi:HD-GYP domain-containing protein (c-di-GMP phosphodiesterase class II)